MARRAQKRRQERFAFPIGWGGRREGSGPKAMGQRPAVSHHGRAALASRFPVHVTMRLRDGLPSLRTQRAFAVLLAAFAAMQTREEFRLVHYSVQSNHVHLICEAGDRVGLARGLQALAIRIAKRLNSLWQRAGSLFADRYHDRILRTPREVRYAIAYVLNNAAKHGVKLAPGRPDPRSSGIWFDGWRESLRRANVVPSPLARAKTWLLSTGWTRWGRIRLLEIPRSNQG